MDYDRGMSHVLKPAARCVLAMSAGQRQRGCPNKHTPTEGFRWTLIKSFLLSSFLDRSLLSVHLLSFKKSRFLKCLCLGLNIWVENFCPYQIWPQTDAWIDSMFLLVILITPPVPLFCHLHLSVRALGSIPFCTVVHFTSAKVFPTHSDVLPRFWDHPTNMIYL